jgi:hypothetical protein
MNRFQIFILARLLGISTMVSTFPSSKIRSMDFAIHDSALGKGYPSCDKTYSALLGTKPVEGLVLNQSTWAKSESNLRLCTTLAFSPVVEEEFLVADLLRYPAGFPEAFFIEPVSEWD